MRIVLLIIILFASCHSLKNPKNYYDLKVGESFSFEVKANPSTPTEWQWINQNSVKNVSLTSKTYKSDCDEDDFVAGCGGKETWTFKAVKKGKEVLKIHHIYYGDDKAFEKHDIIVEVK